MFRRGGNKKQYFGSPVDQNSGVVPTLISRSVDFLNQCSLRFFPRLPLFSFTHTHTHTHVTGTLTTIATVRRPRGARAFPDQRTAGGDQRNPRAVGQGPVADV